MCLRGLLFITFRPKKIFGDGGKHAANLFCKQNLPMLELEIIWLRTMTMNSFTFNFMESLILWILDKKV